MKPRAVVAVAEIPNKAEIISHSLSSYGVGAFGTDHDPTK